MSGDSSNFGLGVRRTTRPSPSARRRTRRPQGGEAEALDLKRLAASISRSYGDQGAIIVTVCDGGYRVGVHGLDANEAKDALCVAIYHVVSKSLD